MRTPARLSGRRTLVAAALTLATLLGTTAATVAQPLGDRAGAPGPTVTTDLDEADREAAWVAARVGAVRPAPAPIGDLADAPPRVFASYEGVELVEPAPDALAIGFHQAGGTHPGLVPVGTVVENANPGGTAAIDARPDGAEVLVMPSRGRGGPGTSAVDVALTPGALVRSVVTGTVTAVQSYALYGEHADVLIEIQPAGRPDLRVMLYHLTDIRINVGDEVFAGLTPIAGSARHIPVTNQVDRYAATCPCPHVDIRIRQV